MDKARFKKYFFTMLPFSMILGAVAFSAFTGGNYWFALIAIAWLVFGLYRQYSYFSKAEPELLAAPKEANKGLWKSILAFFLATFIVTVAYTYFQFPEIYVQYIAIGLGVLFTGYILWRHFKAFRKAKLAVKSRKALEATSKNMNHDQPP